MSDNPYATSSSTLIPDEEVTYAGFWSRALASIIDTIWLFGLIYTVLYFMFGTQLFDQDAEMSLTRILIEYVVPIIVVISFWIFKSATPGKIVLKMKIVDADNHGRVPPGRLILRYVAYYISMLPLFLGFMWVGWDSKKQGWHDKIAKTVVIKG